jgi:FSR family fosmidomycin resistance protein-like MFS transporter
MKSTGAKISFDYIFLIMRANRFPTGIISSNLIVYGTMHALIDATCAGVIFTISKKELVSTPDFYNLVLLYGILAFGLQALLGLALDYYKAPRVTALAGCILTGVSTFLFWFFPFWGVVLAGLGNALFHIGGGTISLNLTPQKATAPGIFVAPGAFGLFAGTLIGKSGLFTAWPFLVLLFIFSILMFAIRKPEIDYDRKRETEKKLNYFGIIFLFIFLAVAIRSLVGFVLVFPWKSNSLLALLLTMGVVLGKASGGILADKIGWVKVAVGASLWSIPFLVFGANIYYLAIFGIFLFNMTMPITLTALSNMLPGRPAFAFGLTCLALLLGDFPILMGYGEILNYPLLIFAVILASASCLNSGLQMLLKNDLFPE